MKSTMQQRPLLVSQLFEYGKTVHPTSEVITFEGASLSRKSFEETSIRAEKLANALKKLGIKPDDRVATFGMNHQEHLECYMAIPSMGAILHTLNVRLFPEQLSYIISDAEDSVIIFDSILTPVLAGAKDALNNVKYLVSIGEGDTGILGREIINYEDLIKDEPTGYDWPDLDENEAASMCYTSGTTGNPKGVVYSHRSIYLHTIIAGSASTLGISAQDRALIIVPMFHVNAWGTPYSCWIAGADMLMPKQFLQAKPLLEFINTAKPTIAAGVPTIWNDLLSYAETEKLDLSSMRLVVAGGSAVPRKLIEAFKQRYNVRLLQGWGMTETSPLCALSFPPKGSPVEEEVDWLSKTGTIVPGVEIRITDEDGTVLPNDGDTVGEFEVRGPWIAGAYFKGVDPEKFHQGWLRTGDVGTLGAHGQMQITDRTKDVIKSGGEWISSVDLENTIMLNDNVHEAAVVGIPDGKWDERPLACVVLKENRSFDAQAVATWLAPKVARWWLPDYWCQLESIPKTSVGKFDKKVIRKMVEKKEIEIITINRNTIEGD